MKQIIIIASVLLFSLSSLASTYQCRISKDVLGPYAELDLDFTVTQSTNSTISLSILGDLVSANCPLVANVTYECRDDEHMPYLVELFSVNDVYLSIGYMLPRTKAICSLR